MHNLHQDRLSEHLIKFYFDYGITYSSNPLFRSYWYSRRFKHFQSDYSEYNMRFFRRFYYANDIVGVEDSYLLRNHSGEYFSLRLWLFKFLGWVIFSVQWFKPVKRKVKAKRQPVQKLKTNVAVASNGAGSVSTEAGLNRLRLGCRQLLKPVLKFRKDYCF